MIDSAAPTALSSAATRPTWATLPVLLAGAFVVVLDFFIVNVALPSMATDLGAGPSSLEWVVAGYGLSYAAFMITAGRLGDQFGRRRLFTIGLVAFTATSAACGLAPSPESLVAARIAQGLAAGVLAPQVLSIIGVTYQGTAYVRALAAYGVVLGLAAVGGQVIGGALVELDLGGAGWRACFLLNVPIGVVALVATPRAVPESRSADRVRLDPVGTVVLALGLVAIMLPLIEGRRLGWPAWSWISLAAAPLVLGLFAVQQSRRAAAGRGALLDLSLFGSRSFSAGLITQLFLAGAQASFFVFLALYLQQGRGLSALDAGLVFTILAVAYVAVSGPAPRLTERFGRSVITVGGAVLTLGLVMLTVAIDRVGVGGSLPILVPGLLGVGAGIGLCFTPLTSTILSNVASAKVGAASGTLATTQQVGFALGVAVTGLIYFAEDDPARAFELSLLQLSALAAGIVVMSLVLPRRAARRPGTGTRDVEHETERVVDSFPAAPPLLGDADVEHVWQRAGFIGADSKPDAADNARLLVDVDVDDLEGDGVVLTLLAFVADVS